MEDLAYVTNCKHKITSELLSIRRATNKDGEIIEGIYIANTEHKIIPMKGRTFIRSYNAEQAYFNNPTVYYTDHLNYAHRTLDSLNYEDIPAAGLISEIGITNYEFTGTKEITFGKLDSPCTDINIDPNLVPANKYYIDYFVDPKDCPICLGSNYVQDIGYNGYGEISKVSGHKKLSQRVLKTLLTTMGTSPEDANYGSQINSFIGSNIDMGLTISLQKVIYEAVQYLIQLQNGTYLTPEETCTGIYNIDVDTTDQVNGKVVLTLTILDGNGDKVPCTVVLGV